MSSSDDLVAKILARKKSDDSEQANHRRLAAKLTQRGAQLKLKRNNFAKAMDELMSVLYDEARDSGSKNLSTGDMLLLRVIRTDIRDRAKELAEADELIAEIISRELWWRAKTI